MADHLAATRRQLLAAASVGAAAAMGLSGSVSGCAAPSGEPATAGGDVALARQTARASARLLAAYRATTRRHSELRGLLQPLAAHHAEHLAVYAPAGPPTAAAPAVPDHPIAALDGLRRLETSVAATRRRTALEAGSGDLARALAATVACQAQHQVLLAAGADRSGAGAAGRA